MHSARDNNALTAATEFEKAVKEREERMREEKSERKRVTEEEGEGRGARGFTSIYSQKITNGEEGRRKGNKRASVWTGTVRTAIKRLTYQEKRERERKRRKRKRERERKAGLVNYRRRWSAWMKGFAPVDSFADVLCHVIHFPLPLLLLAYGIGPFGVFDFVFDSFTFCHSRTSQLLTSLPLSASSPFAFIGLWRVRSLPLSRFFDDVTLLCETFEKNIKKGCEWWKKEIEWESESDLIYGDKFTIRH